MSNFPRSAMCAVTLAAMVVSLVFCPIGFAEQSTKNVLLIGWDGAQRDHVKELLASDMMREASLPNAEKAYRVEKYYEPNFPVLLEEDVNQLEPACRKVAERIAKIYWEHKDELEEAFAGTFLEDRGYGLENILDFLYSKIRRLGREILDEQGFFPELPTHQDGSRWVYWAEEIKIE